ncbi:MAG: iron-containing alcohol dehydrogenase [Verrucomicrobiales bacterium]|nr:iron-containing alcohol dehydrogenase [Verrucomicrobiales bacterium]
MSKSDIIIENHLPRRVITGRGASLGLVQICLENNWQRAFVVSDQGVHTAGLTDRVCQPLQEASLWAGSFLEVPPEPPFNVVDAIGVQIQRCKADVVIALGGGSVIDAAKVAALCAYHKKPAIDFSGIGKAGGRGLPTVLIPTTAGTGSEATYVAILTDPESGNKVGVVDPSVLADIAIVDPALTDGLPISIAAAAGMDALVHALEAFIAKVCTPLARGLALQAAKKIGASLEGACSHSASNEERDGMAIGSHLAGMAFANSSCCAVHGLALPLGGRFKIPHGVITGCFVGEVMRHNSSACGDDFLLFSQALGWGGMKPDSFANKLDELASHLGLVDHLKKVPVGDEMVEVMAQDAVANRRLMDPNPSDVSVKDAARIYRKVLNL